jgi:hypothetical protein
MSIHLKSTVKAVSQKGLRRSAQALAILAAGAGIAVVGIAPTAAFAQAKAPQGGAVPIPAPVVTVPPSHLLPAITVPGRHPAPVSSVPPNRPVLPISVPPNRPVLPISVPGKQTAPVITVLPNQPAPRITVPGL